MDTYHQVTCLLFQLNTGLHSPPTSHGHSGKLSVEVWELDLHGVEL